MITLIENVEVSKANIEINFSNGTQRQNPVLFDHLRSSPRLILDLILEENVFVIAESDKDQFKCQNGLMYSILNQLIQCAIMLIVLMKMIIWKSSNQLKDWNTLKVYKIIRRFSHSNSQIAVLLFKLLNLKFVCLYRVFKKIFNFVYIK